MLRLLANRAHIRTAVTDTGMLACKRLVCMAGVDEACPATLAYMSYGKDILLTVHSVPSRQPVLFSLRLPVCSAQQRASTTPEHIKVDFPSQ